MKVTVLLFASYREAAGWRSRELEVPVGATAGDVLALVRRTSLLMLPGGARPLLAVNRKHVLASHVVADGDEVGVFPPVSGGSGADARATIGPEPLNAQSIADSVRHPSCGAVVTFEGVVREESDGLVVESIEYEAYVEMARSVLDEILREVELRHPACRVAAAHRTGMLAVGEASVVAAAAAPHRREAFAACRMAIDRIKESLPIWKQERGAGKARWR